MWRHSVINFDWKCCFKSFSRKNVHYKRFHHFALSSKQENKFLRFQWHHNDLTTPLDQKYDWWQAVFYSLTYREQYSADKSFSEENAERFEIETCLTPYISPNPNSTNRRALCADKKMLQEHRAVTIARFAWKWAIFLVFAGKTGKQYQFSLKDSGKLQFLDIFNLALLNLVCPRQNFKRPIGFFYDSV